jgi:hypothetical protein
LGVPRNIRKRGLEIVGQHALDRLVSFVGRLQRSISTGELVGHRSELLLCSLASRDVDIDLEVGGRLAEIVAGDCPAASHNDVAPIAGGVPQFARPLPVLR